MKLNLGENIRKYRKRLDWMQEQLADRLGVAYQSVSRWESGAGYPDMEHLPVLARLFSVTLDDLVGCHNAKEKLPRDKVREMLEKTVRSGNVDDAVSIMRLIRYEYLNDFDQIYFPLYILRHGKLSESSKFMNELRLLVGEYLKYGKQQHAKTSLIKIMVNLEDDKH